MSERVTFLVSPELLARLEAAVAGSEVHADRSVLIRQALVEKLEKLEAKKNGQAQPGQ